MTRVARVDNLPLDLWPRGWHHCLYQSGSTGNVTCVVERLFICLVSLSMWHCDMVCCCAHRRPSGSSDVYYVDSGTEEMSAALSETTMESTHPGISLMLSW